MTLTTPIKETNSNIASTVGLFIGLCSLTVAIPLYFPLAPESFYMALIMSSTGFLMSNLNYAPPSMNFIFRAVTVLLQFSVGIGFHSYYQWLNRRPLSWYDKLIQTTLSTSVDFLNALPWASSRWYSEHLSWLLPSMIEDEHPGIILRESLKKALVILFFEINPLSSLFSGIGKLIRSFRENNEYNDPMTDHELEQIVHQHASLARKSIVFFTPLVSSVLTAFSTLATIDLKIGLGLYALGNLLCTGLNRNKQAYAHQQACELHPRPQEALQTLRSHDDASAPLHWMYQRSIDAGKLAGRVLGVATSLGQEEVNALRRSTLSARLQ